MYVIVCRRDEEQRLYDQLLTIEVMEDLLAKLRGELPNDMCVYVLLVQRLNLKQCEVCVYRSKF